MRIAKIKMGIIVLAILLLLGAKYNGGREVFIAKVTSFQAWILLILRPSTVGYFKGLLNLGQEKKN
jgi:hypothetical protein